MAFFALCQAVLVSGDAFEHSLFLDTLMSAWALAATSISLREPCGSSSLSQSSCLLSCLCEWTNGMNPSQCLTICTVTHWRIFSKDRSNSTNLMGECSARSIQPFHPSDGSLSNGFFPTVFLAALRALFQEVAWTAVTCTSSFFSILFFSFFLFPCGLLGFFKFLLQFIILFLQLGICRLPFPEVHIEIMVLCSYLANTLCENIQLILIFLILVPSFQVFLPVFDGKNPPGDGEIKT